VSERTERTDPGDLVARLRRGPALPADPANANGRGPDPGGLAAVVEAALARADRDDLVDVGWVVTDSPVGPLTLAATPEGLVRVGFGTEEGVLEDLAAAVSPRVVRLPARLDDLRRQLDEYFAGRRHRFEVPLDRRLSHGYRRQVLEALSDVPYGETVSYKDLAVRTGNPGASRAVGTAMATNPLPIVVPCHRVLLSGGALGGYGGGIETKVWLLRLEGALAL
jgi:methylated-DNA-[protein]-cysteine S-methyltransferase